MTITEAVKIVLYDFPNGLTSKAIYEEIIKRELYVFPAKNPQHVVNGIIRRHCLELDFPTANPVKYFKIVRYEGKKPIYTLIETSVVNEIKISKQYTKEDNELLPEEKIKKIHDEHLDYVYNALLDNIMSNDSSFFEHLIVDLLLKMGYGYDHDSGIVVGGSHDSGIDGIISEDKLGLDLIYLQAKRYSFKNKVGSKELQAFVGAMQNVQKGVFITTSGYTTECIKYVEKQQQKNIKLIDGRMLVKYMVKYEVGVACQESIKIYKIEGSYFE